MTPQTGTLYVSTDFTVLADTPRRTAHSTATGGRPAAGLPQVEVAGVTIDQKTHTLYAATHGRSDLAAPLSVGREPDAW